MKGGGKPTIFLHIGRNKAGSTTLQDFFAAQAQYLAANGVDYVLCGRLQNPGTTLRTLPALADVLAALHAGNRSILVSDEMISAFPPPVSQAAAAAFRGVNVQVLLYVRPYRDWVRSSYGFDVRIGYNARDFDTYLEQISPSLSFLPNLHIWADAVGWRRIRVRSTHPTDLAGGTLAHDSMAAMGLQPPDEPQQDRSNATPHWIAVEILRMAAASHASEGWTFTGRAIAESLHELAEAAITEAGSDCPVANYLNSAQSRALAALYNRDLAELARHTGVTLQPDDAAQAPERSFLPSAGAIPQRILRGIAERATSPAYARLHPEAAAFVASREFAGLLELGSRARQKFFFEKRNQKTFAGCGQSGVRDVEPSAMKPKEKFFGSFVPKKNRSLSLLAPAPRNISQQSGDLQECQGMSSTTERPATHMPPPGATQAAATAHALACGKKLDAALLAAIAQWRVDAAAALPACGPHQWPQALPDPFPGQIGIPCVDAASLSAAVIGGAILHHGLLRVNGLVNEAQAEQLRLGIETAMAARDAYKNKGDIENDGWYAPLDVPMLAFKRDFVERCGALWTADSPRMLHEIIDIYSRIGLIDCIAEHMQERPALSVRKSTLRRVPITTSTDWHQDGAFLGKDTRAVNVWLALSPCGIDAAGLDVVARRVPYIIQTGSHGSWFDWSVGSGMVDMLVAGGASVLSPEFKPGDALLFDHMMLHRTGIRPGMDRDRYAIESWFFAPTNYPADQVPLLV